MSALAEHCSSPPPRHHPAAKGPFSLIYAGDGGTGLIDRSAALGFAVPWVQSVSWHHGKGVPVPARLNTKKIIRKEELEIMNMHPSHS